MTERHWTWSDNSDAPSAMMPYQSTSDWLSEIMKTAFPDLAIGAVLRLGLGVDPIVALRLKALDGELAAPPWMAPPVATPTLLSELCALADARHHSSGPGLANRVEGQDLIGRLTEPVRQRLLGYAALDLLRPKIITAVRSVDVLCSPNDIMPAPVLLKLALARAYGEERTHVATHDHIPQSTWEAVVHAWDRDMAHAKATVKRWADLVVQGRMRVGQADSVFVS